jgi:serine/threonine protein kinase
MGTTASVSITTFLSVRGYIISYGKRGILVGNVSDWEKVRNEPLGRGGQSEVYLVRRPFRKQARDIYLKNIRDLSDGALRNGTEITFSIASAEIARAERPEELAALKHFIPRTDLGPAADQSAIERLHNEIEVLQKKHDGFVKLLDSNEDQRWIVTEFCSNGTLEDNLSKYKGNALASLTALVPHIKAVGDLHQEGIVHRDIKPQNIFVAEDGRLLLGDFGLAFLPDHGARVTKFGESVGPREFMPPWIDLDDQPATVKPNFDVYMLGKVLWCMVSGQVKLPRENFHHPKFNVVKLFPSDPHMYAINQILEKSVVAEEQDCYGSAIDLWLMAGKISQIIERGAQLLNEGIPRPCHICGNGYYEPEIPAPGQPHATVSFQLNRNTITSGEYVGGFKAVPYCCNYCHHVQFFKSA